MNENVEEVKNITLGQINFTTIKIYGKNIDSEDPSFSFDVVFPDGEKYSENDGGFEYETEEDAFNAALDFLVDHASFHQTNQKEMNRRAKFNADLNGNFEIYDENPEDNVEEVPEDFRLDMKK